MQSSRGVRSSSVHERADGCPWAGLYWMCSPASFFTMIYCWASGDSGGSSRFVAWQNGDSLPRKCYFGWTMRTMCLWNEYNPPLLPFYDWSQFHCKEQADWIRSNSYLLAPVSMWDVFMWTLGIMFLIMMIFQLVLFSWRRVLTLHTHSSACCTIFQWHVIHIFFFIHFSTVLFPTIVPKPSVATVAFGHVWNQLVKVLVSTAKGEVPSQHGSVTHWWMWSEMGEQLSSAPIIRFFHILPS